MLTEHDFLAVIEAYAAANGLQETTVSYRLFNDGKRVAAIRGGASITLRLVNHALQYLSDDWPRGAKWPKGVCRPRKQLEGAQ